MIKALVETSLLCDDRYSTDSDSGEVSAHRCCSGSGESVSGAHLAEPDTSGVRRLLAGGDIHPGGGTGDTSQGNLF